MFYNFYFLVIFEILKRLKIFFLTKQEYNKKINIIKDKILLRAIIN